VDLVLFVVAYGVLSAYGVVAGERALWRTLRVVFAQPTREA
jgi:hypothetical protein